MSDDEGDWKPNKRPQSMMARSFSAALNDAFGIDSDVGKGAPAPGEADVGELFQSVEQKKQALNTRTQELEALEARLRDTEERLKARSRGVSPHPEGEKSPMRRKQVGSTNNGPSPGESAVAPTTSRTTSAGETAGQSFAGHSSGGEYDMPGGFAVTPAETPGKELGASEVGLGRNAGQRGN
ncbi:MAG: hypothetical protein M1833_006763 [Piccolia ochrophora]|nr:MAG: hypothetical protein M1833_006763 [Piccolia ochrophora]